MENQIVQLSQQVAQLAIILSQGGSTQPLTSSVPMVEVINNSASTPDPTPQEVDPVIIRLSQYLDDF
jgi:hypothetical protein